MTLWKKKPSLKWPEKETSQEDGELFATHQKSQKKSTKSPKMPSKDGSVTDAENSSSTTTTPTDNPVLDWFGVQLYCRAQGTNEIVQRSFPFWANKIEDVKDHVKKTNKLSKQERTWWTHLHIISHYTEDKNGAKQHYSINKEEKL